MGKKISELKDGDKKVIISEATVVKKEKPRGIKTKYGQTKISEALIEDVSGDIMLVLWGDRVSQVSEGDRIQIINGYVQERNGLLQISVGKYGTIKNLSQ